MLVKQSLTALRATRRAQRLKQKISTYNGIGSKLRNGADMLCRETQKFNVQSTLNQATRLGLRNASTQGCQETEACEDLPSKSQKENCLLYL